MCEPEQELRTSATNDKPSVRPVPIVTDIPADVAATLIESRVRIPNVLVAVAILHAMDGVYMLDLNTAPDDEVSLGFSAGEYFAYAVLPDASRGEAARWLQKRAEQFKRDVEVGLKLIEWMGRLHNRY